MFEEKNSQDNQSSQPSAPVDITPAAPVPAPDLPQPSAPASKESKKKLIIIIVSIGVAVLLIAGGAAAFYYYSYLPSSSSNVVPNNINAPEPEDSQETPEPEATPEIDDQQSRMMDWKTYTNPRLGIEFKYPEGWIADTQQSFMDGESSSGQRTIVVFNSDYPFEGSSLFTSFSIYLGYGFTNLENIKSRLEEEIMYSQEPRQSSTAEVSQLEKIVFNNKDAFKYSSEIGFPEEEWIGSLISINILDGNLYYKITYMVSNKYTGDREKLLNIYEDILSTIEFIMPEDDKTMTPEETAEIIKAQEESKIISNIMQLQTAVEIFFNDNARYPFPPIGGNKLGVDSTCLSSDEFGLGCAPTVYMSKVLKHPRSPQTDYLYYLCSEKEYIILFEINATVGTLDAGVNFATQNGRHSELEINDDCLDPDEDGLSNYFEDKYGTDKNNPDSDGDGYLDGAEVIGGYNPAGEGTLE